MRKATGRKPLFERLKSALKEGIEFAQGAVDLRVAAMPAPPPELNARQITQLRRRFNLSQHAFARTLNVATKTIQSWEQVNRRPSQAALRLLQFFAERPELVCGVLGIANNRDSKDR
jgi:DNA-binding transcriptional regulator YiaG